MIGKVWSCSVPNPKFSPRSPPYKRQLIPVEGAGWCRSLHPVHGKKLPQSSVFCSAADGGGGDKDVHLVSQEGELWDSSLVCALPWMESWKGGKWKG